VFIKIDFGESKILLMMRTISNIIIFSNIIMAYGKKPYRKRPASKKPFRRSTRRTGSTTKAFTKKVQSIIHRNVENKTFQYNSDGAVPIVNYNNTSWVTYGWGLPLSPYTGILDIPIATGQGARIGNSIAVRKLTFKGVIYPAPYNSSTNPTPKPHEVKFWIVHDKLYPSNGPLSTSYGTFFQNGSSSSSFSTNLIDMIKTVNQDRFVVHATKTFKVGYALYEGNGLSGPDQYYANNDFKFNHKFSFDLTKEMVKNVKYNDASQVPTTRGLFLVAEAVRADGTSSAGAQATVIPVLMEYQLNIVYEDA